MLALDTLSHDTITPMHISESNDGQELSLNASPWPSDNDFGFAAEWSSNGHSLSGNSISGSKSDGSLWQGGVWSAPQEPIVQINGSDLYTSQHPNMEGHHSVQIDSRNVLGHAQRNTNSPIVYQPTGVLPPMEMETQDGLIVSVLPLLSLLSRIISSTRLYSSNEVQLAKPCWFHPRLNRQDL
jgi:hypothetical protein